MMEKAAITGGSFLITKYADKLAKLAKNNAARLEKAKDLFDELFGDK